MNRYTKIRNLHIAQLGGKCARCPSTEDLEFDHIDPTTKSFNVSSNLTSKKVGEELAKCQLLCNPCHEEKTLTERNPPKHGTRSCYVTGCRCEPCSAAHRDYMREYMRKRAAA